MPTWRIAEPAALVWRRWEDELVVYDDQLAMTHCLPAELADVFEALARSPQGVSESALRALVPFDGEGGDDPQSSMTVDGVLRLEAVLAELGRIGLVTEVP